MFCRNCGTQLKDDAKFCSGCGLQLQEIPVADTAADREQAAAPVEETVISQPGEEQTAEPAPEVAEEQTAAPAPEAVEEQPAEPAPEAQEEQVAQPTPAPTPAPGYIPQPIPVARPTYASTGAESPLVKAKNMSGSALALVATILYSIFAVLQIVTFPEIDLTSLVMAMGLGSELAYMDSFVASNILNLLEIAETGIVILFWANLIPVFLIAVGLWINFVSAKTQGSTGTAGLTMVKTAAILRLIGKIFVVALGAGLIVFGGEIMEEMLSEFMLYGYYEEGYYDPSLGMMVNDTISSASIALGLLGVAVILTQIIPIVYDCLVISSVNSIKKTIRTNQPAVSGFGGVCVFNYLSVVGIVMGLMSMIIMEPIMENVFSMAQTGMYSADGMLYAQTYVIELIKGDALTVLAQVILAVVLVLFSVNITSYKKRL